jgi:hypothetical protein
MPINSIWHCYCFNIAINHAGMMERGDSNTYRFYGEVAEVIYSEDASVIKLVCKSGSIIIQIPYDPNVKLGDRFLVTGKLKLILTEKLPVSYEQNFENGL